MSLVDKIAAAVMPPESDRDRETARTISMALTSEGDWLALVVSHHRCIEAGFAAALAAGRDERLDALKQLSVLLGGHANAEESVIYPLLSVDETASGAAMAYDEQAAMKIELAALERIDPSSPAWSEKLRHIQGAVLHHVYEEEGSWFPRLQQSLLAVDRMELTRRYAEEFERHVGEPARLGPAVAF